MYSNLKNVQYLISMLKEQNVRHIVVSPGNSHNAIVRSLENDSFFKTYNIVDERSAAFFALGLIQELQDKVAICCTSGTAATNYLTGVTEASRRKLPLIVITGDKNPYYLAQQTDQMIDQVNLFKTVIKYSVSLPLINNEKDEWYCKRLLNEVFLELDHHGVGPVQINVPIEEGMLAIDEYFNSTELPKINVIKRYDMNSNRNELESKFKSLKNKKVLIIYGQDYVISKECIKNLEKIQKNYNCVIGIDKLSNLKGEGIIEISRAALLKRMQSKFEDLVPDIVITLAGNVAWDGKFALKSFSKMFEHWIINSDGKVQDFYKNLTTIFEMSTSEFIDIMSRYDVDNSKEYHSIWEKATSEFKMPEFKYSNLYATQKLMNNMPEKSILNLGNSTTIRIAEYFDINENIKIYCNRGVNGIDGCMSSYIGQSAATNKLSFLIIGDLTFFYDMNSLWNRYISKNVRIMLINNEGTTLFHFSQGLKKYPTLNENVAAEHFASAKGWAESLGFKYICSKNKEEFDKNIEEFIKEDSEMPILFEVFTKKEEDAAEQKEFFNSFLNSQQKIIKNTKNIIKKVIKNR